MTFEIACLLFGVFACGFACGNFIASIRRPVSAVRYIEIEAGRRERESEMRRVAPLDGRASLGIMGVIMRAHPHSVRGKNAN